MHGVTTAQLLILVVAMLTFGTATLGFLTSVRNSRRLATATGQIQEVHVLVNSQLTAVTARVSQLVNAMEHAGVAVPPNQNGEGGTAGG
jgi:hypothetical protein